MALHQNVLERGGERFRIIDHSLGVCLAEAHSLCMIFKFSEMAMMCFLFRPQFLLSFIGKILSKYFSNELRELGSKSKVFEVQVRHLKLSKI